MWSILLIDFPAVRCADVSENGNPHFFLVRVGREIEEAACFGFSAKPADGVIARAKIADYVWNPGRVPLEQILTQAHQEKSRVRNGINEPEPEKLRGPASSHDRGLGWDDFPGKLKSVQADDPLRLNRRPSEPYERVEPPVHVPAVEHRADPVHVSLDIFKSNFAGVESGEFRRGRAGERVAERPDWS